ncbi:Lipolytic protein G-D-S-L family [uncultured spirochete]|jgi:lysophospholipase L1-like esterase|uniref:Lipolytic protein G-D-S-L family n=1 Tax=uncultured spirochete TaxID=156406 RepID=A0A3P3XM26_9SPIR|nr:Lipolytic protein G-D-S-L family [uncultured spirochete]
MVIDSNILAIKEKYLKYIWNPDDGSVSFFPALKDGTVIVFQGDSITDANRDRSVLAPNDMFGLGGGYVFLAAATLLSHLPDRRLRIYNRGISGDKITTIAKRWEQDTLALNPDFITVLVGVNDYWHISKHGYKGSVELYKETYKNLIARTMKVLPQARLIICEPFAIRCGYVDESWFPEFSKYQAVAFDIAESSGAIFLPFQSLFEVALRVQEATYWCPDGVHPSAAGAYLMASAWLNCIAMLDDR